MYWLKEPTSTSNAKVFLIENVSALKEILYVIYHPFYVHKVHSVINRACNTDNLHCTSKEREPSVRKGNFFF